MAAEPLVVRFRRLERAGDLPLPGRASAGSAGLDLRAAVDGELTLAPGRRAVVPTGVAVELPAGWEGQVRPRSGLAARHGLGLLNAPGTIDSDYRGEIRVVLINHGAEAFTIRRGDRIAQLVIAPVAVVEVVESPRLGATERGGGGFGSTGID